MSLPEPSPGGAALVTGASAGIGVAYAEQLSAMGYDLVLVARRRERLEAVATRLGRAEVVVADLWHGLKAVEEAAAGVDLLVNNAGFGGYGRFATLEARVSDELIAVHVSAVTRLSRAALPKMIERGSGGIINVASLLALSGTLPVDPLPARAVYSGCKAFMLAFTQTLAQELGGTGVTVQCCLPGRVATEFHSSQGMPVIPGAMSAEDVVTASLAALARRELVCVPGLDDASQFDRVGEAQRAVLGSANRQELAQRYRNAERYRKQER
jgi:short-subunit dehydrogenase